MRIHHLLLQACLGRLYFMENLVLLVATTEA